MAVLTEALLRAQGYTCWRAPEGADGGIDLLAGSGPLGLDAPQLVVQVKSEQSPVGDPVISQLLGTTTKHGPAAQGLLVAWGGLTPPAQRSARDNYFRLRVWTASDVIAQVTRHYDDTARGDPHRPAAQADLDRSGGGRMIEPGQTYWLVNKPPDVDMAGLPAYLAEGRWISPTPSRIGRSSRGCSRASPSPASRSLDARVACPSSRATTKPR